MNRLSHLVVVIGVAIALCAHPAGAADAPAPPRAPVQEQEPEDVKIGRQNAAELDKQLKLITNPAVVDRVSSIGQEIAAIANTEIIPVLYGLKEHRRFTYTFKVVEDKEVNAFSLPGGFIYVNTGLLDFVRSDDELAGVIAHEIVHASHRHMIKLISEANREQTKAFWVAIGAALAGRVAGNSGYGVSNDVGNLMLAAQLYTLARVNSWSMEAERDSDQGGVRYMLKTRFKPVGMLTFMERLARQEAIGVQHELGYLRNHPRSVERSDALTALLQDLKIPLNRRDVDPTLRAVVQTLTLNGVGMAEVRLGDTVVARVAAAGDQTADARARALAQSVNLLFDQGLQGYEVRIAAGGSRVMVRGRSLVTFTPADALAQKTTEDRLARDTQQAIQMLLWKDLLNRAPTAASGA